MEKHYIYLQEDLCKKIIGQLEKKFMVKLSFQGVLGKQREK